MTETILNSMYYQILFIKGEKDVIYTIQTKEDVASFIEAILYSMQNSQFYVINYYRFVDLQEVLHSLLQEKDFLLSKELKEQIVKLIQYCEDIKSGKIDNILDKDCASFFYSVHETNKRHLTNYSIMSPSPEEVDLYLIRDYEIIYSLVKYKRIIGKHKLSSLLSAFSLLITTYPAILHENPEVYFFIHSYLNILSEKINIESLFKKSRIKAILQEYQNLQQDFIGKEKFAKSFERKEEKEGL